MLNTKLENLRCLTFLSTTKCMDITTTHEMNEILDEIMSFDADFRTLSNLPICQIRTLGNLPNFTLLFTISCEKHK